MKKKLIIFSAIIALFAGIVIFLFKVGILPPRTVWNVAERVSKLHISRKTKVVKFEEHYTFGDAGDTDIAFSLTDVQLEKLRRECQHVGYKKITTENLKKDGLLIDSKNGYYLYQARELKHSHYSITILDIKNKELTIYINYN